MRLQRDTHVATGEGFDSVADFAIEMNDKAFTVLSDTIYKDKIGSIVRELSCNAFDAHIEAGISDTPFEIHLPDAFEPHFAIRDFGPGISPKDIREVYTRYFSSTKDNSNDVVGAFGLGSKTPFAYTDAFTVISIHKGVKTMYNAHKSKGMPAIVAYGEAQETDEPDGLEVRVSVQAQDYKAFSSALKRQLKFFPVKPTITNGSIEWETYTPILEVKGFTYYNVDGATNRRYSYGRNDSFVTEGLFIKQGPVAYPVDFDSLNQVLDSKGEKRDAFYSYLQQAVGSHTGKGIIIDMPIGTVEVTASREGISYKDITVQNIMTRLNQIAKVISKEVQIKLDKAYDEGILSFVQVLDSLDGYFKHSLTAKDMDKRYPKFKFYNTSYGVDGRLQVASDTFHDLEVRKYDIANYVQPRASQARRLIAAPVDENDASKGREKTISLNLKELAGHTDIDGQENVIYVKDINNGFVARLKEYNQGPMVILLETPDGVDRDDIQKALGDEFVVRNVSELPKVATQRKASGGHSITDGRQRLWFNIGTNNIQSYGIFNGIDTLYAGGCSQHFGEKFDEAEHDAYAYFTTFNNKLNRDNFFDKNQEMVTLFCEWLVTHGYQIVGIADRMTTKAEKTGKFHCVNKLWSEYKSQFEKETWDMFAEQMLTNYYTALDNQFNNAANFPYGQAGQHSLGYYSELFTALGMTSHDKLTEQAKMLADLGTGSNRISSAMEMVIRDNMSKDKIDLFVELRGYLEYINGHRDSVKAPLEDIEAALETAGATIEVKGSELVDGYIDLIKKNLDKLVLASAIKNNDNRSFKLAKVQFREPFNEGYRLDSDEILESLRKKVGVGA